MPSTESKKVHSCPGLLTTASTLSIEKGILNNAITTLTDHAERNGLTSQEIARLIDVLVLPGGLDKSSMSRILESLYPNAKIEEGVAVKIISCLGLGTERAKLQIQVVHFGVGLM